MGYKRNLGLAASVSKASGKRNLLNTMVASAVSEKDPILESEKEVEEQEAKTEDMQTIFALSQLDRIGKEQAVPGYEAAKKGYDKLVSLGLKPDEDFPSIDKYRYGLKPGISIGGEYWDIKRDLGWIGEVGSPKSDAILDLINSLLDGE